ncbi:TIGR03668 family PPOX class F420-dependent oxidoreductase [Isoptericola sp. b441]|uniref:TIGR03668 family PPOX class F420-dependent oxidoreductase n=1 Tax=Actinotalea lenta TaxID=3064654 RepID=A0ABT9DCS2_9CELL|nr:MULTISPECIES: TIGR03668 family PPOX class F420-dependent oxidoreductase [unclassified Isoptericola]MDO8107008.1 TIGR03668 family PPOX class F420-dependent oxidoreductase [Isoptericola sp. b441]MDO8121282.1 TIGR03668 family PPOX class F420-dependent oxidoreductase [Isoptericola sp. b490]
MDVDECRHRFAAAPHGYLATADPAGRPHVVPVTFAVTEDEVVTAVDHKPKRTGDPHRMRRLRNIAANPRVSLLADHYDEEWDELWWVRADATASVVDDGPVHERAVALLAARYPQYREVRPTGPVILATVSRWTGWSAR